MIDLSESDTDERKPIDIYAIGFEEMVDLDAKNIMNTRYRLQTLKCRITRG